MLATEHHQFASMLKETSCTVSPEENKWYEMMHTQQIPFMRLNLRVTPLSSPLLTSRKSNGEEWRKMKDKKGNVVRKRSAHATPLSIQTFGTLKQRIFTVIMSIPLISDSLKEMLRFLEIHLWSNNVSSLPLILRTIKSRSRWNLLWPSHG